MDEMTAQDESKLALSQAADPTLPLDNELHERFAQAFVRLPVAAKAAREAGYSIRSSSKIGYRNLQNPIIQARIRYLKGCNGWSLEYTRAQAYERYEHWKGKSWQADKAFIELMADLMGHRQKSAGDTVSGILDKLGALLTSYNQRYASTQAVDSKQVMEIASENICYVKGIEAHAEGVSSGEVKQLDADTFSQGGGQTAPAAGVS